MSASTHPYDALTPDAVLAAVESAGFACDGRLLALNSFENRVYQIGIEPVPLGDDAALPERFLVAKFYRPQRWSLAQLREEHAFMAELVDAELPVVAPIARDAQTLFEHGGFHFALYRRRGGRAPELEQLETATWLGRTLGRLHAVGARDAFRHRPTIDLATHIDEPERAVLAAELLPIHLEGRYERAIAAARDALAAVFEGYGPLRRLRLHGDCHAGNVLWAERGPLLVDFDDARSGPAVQDVYLLMTGQPAQRSAFLEGYEQFRPFDDGEWALVPALRLMRQIHYAGWVASRWEDPAFPRSFPWAAEARYWEQHVEDIELGAEAL